MTLLRFIQFALEPFSYLVYLGAILIHYRHSGWRSEKWLLAYYLISVVLMAYAANIFSDETNNIWAYNISAVVTLLCISIYFYRLLQATAKKRVVAGLLSIFLVYAIIKNIVLRDILLFDSMAYSYVSAAVSVYVLMYFHQILKNVTETDIFREFNFWLASAYLIYFMGSFIIFASFYYFTNRIIDSYTMPERQLLSTLWGVHNLLLFVSGSGLLLISLWLTYGKKSSPSTLHTALHR